MNPKMRPTVPLVILAAAIIAAPAGLGQKTSTRPLSPAPAALQAIDEMGTELAKLEDSHRNLMTSVAELGGLYAKLAGKAGEVSKLAADARGPQASGQASDRLFRATEEMQKMQQSFNLQYLQLQNKIAHENRQFSMISNIMKNKHDTAKNSINNIR